MIKTEEQYTTKIREYNENMDVIIGRFAPHPYSIEHKKDCVKCEDRYVIQAFNEAGCNSTEVDLYDVLIWVAKNKPDMLSIAALLARD